MKEFFFGKGAPRFAQVVAFSFFIGLMCAAVSARFLSVAPIDDWSDWHKAFFFAFATLNFALITFGLSLPAFLLRLVRLKAVALAWLVLVGSALLIYVVADTFVFQQFRLHMNWAMLQMTLLGGGQVVQLSAKTYALATLAAAICVVGAILCAWVSAWFRSAGAATASLVLAVLLYAGCLGTLGLSQAFHWNQYLTASDVLPLNQPLRFNRLLIKLGWATQEQIDGGRMSTGSKRGFFSAPKNPMHCERGGQNILWLFVDSLRFDMLDQKVMPHTFALAQQSLVFKDHYSGGINTRHGIFTAFTGLPGSYWEAALRSGHTSTLLRELQKKDYAIGLFGSAPLNMPEFHKTIFADIDNLRLFSAGSNPIERDASAVADFKSWIEKLPKQRPFFGFVFLDNVHANAFPMTPDNEIFKPYEKAVNHMELGEQTDTGPIINRYKNAAHFADKNIGQILDFLRAEDLLKNTIVVISSDHGEEFNDNKLNYWWHNGNFTQYQAKVPLVISWPGKDAQIIKRRTSGLDLVPTFLQEVLACNNPLEDYTAGQSLFDDKPRLYLYASNYSNDAFLEKNRIVVIDKAGRFNYYDPNWRKSADKTIPPYSGKILEDRTRFLK